MSDEVMKAFGTLVGTISYMAMGLGVDPEPVLEKITEAVEEWVRLVEK